MFFAVNVECRRVIQPVEDIEDVVKRLNNINLNDVDNEGKIYNFIELFRTFI